MNSDIDTQKSKQPIAARARRNWKWLLPTGTAAVAVLAWLAFGVFGIHTLFFDVEVDEAGPVFSSGAGASGLVSDEVDEDLANEITTAAIEVDMPAEVAADEPIPTAAASPEVVTLLSGNFVDRTHPAEGVASVLGDGSNQRFLRFEDFQVDNGPDLNVYLTRADADADAGDFGRDGDFVDLGDLKGNIGPQNYEIPADVDLEEFDTVVVWCVRFGVAFAAADLVAPASA